MLDERGVHMGGQGMKRKLASGLCVLLLTLAACGSTGSASSTSASTLQRGSAASAATSTTSSGGQPNPKRVTWSSGHQVNPPGDLSSVSCASANFCGGIGGGSTNSEVFTYSNGTWSTGH